MRELDVFDVETIDINTEHLIQQLDVEGRAKSASILGYSEANAGKKPNSHGWPSAVLAAISDLSPKNIHYEFISCHKNLGKDLKCAQDPSPHLGYVT